MNPTPLPIILAIAIASAATQAFAAQSDLVNILTGYTLTSWGQRDGLPPSSIHALAQDAAGYVWLVTETGPLVFDGMRFASWPDLDAPSLPPGLTRSLCISRDGSVWLGFEEPASVSQIKDGRIRSYGPSDGLGPGGVVALVESHDGTIWAGTTEGLYRLVGERWELAGEGLPAEAVYEIYLDRSGRLIVGTAVGTFVRGVREWAFRRIDGPVSAVRGIAESPSGQLWISDAASGFRELSSEGTQAHAAAGNGSRLLYDSKGNLWVGTFGQGLWRVVQPESKVDVIQKTTTLTGLSADGVSALLEDRDGNIWVATNDGLNRLTPHSVTPIVNLGVVYGIEATPDGSVWVGSVDALIEFAPGALGPKREARSFGGLPPSAMCVDEHGALWVATKHELLRFADRRWSAAPLPGAPLQVSMITSDARGGVWLNDRARGLLRWNAGRIEAVDLAPDLRTIQIIGGLTDRRGVVWFALADGRVIAIDASGAVRVYGPADGLRTDIYRVIQEDNEGALWLGGARGLARLDGARFQSLEWPSGFPTGGVTAIFRDDDRALWFGLQGSGVIRLASPDLERALADPGYRLRSVFFDKVDGFAGSPRWFGASSAAQSADGRLWFLAGRGVTILDPKSVRDRRTTASAVRLDRAMAGGRRIRIGTATLPAGQGERLEIQYSSPTLTYPLRTRFRYRLEGLDSDWIDAGTQREAVYTNLAPRSYRFRVVASNDDGTWAEPGVAWEFSIPPQFYQTTWFLTAGVLAILLSIGAGWRLHLHNVRKGFLVLLGERARLSREIHDTVLQGLCGIGLQCDIIAHDHRLTAPQIRERLLGLRGRAEDYAREARRSILYLRSPGMRRDSLADVLRQSGERLIGDNHVRLKVTVNGVPFDNSESVDEQLVRIGQEALLNAILHGRATEVQMDLRYGEAALLLTISDNGRGFNPDSVLESEGHYGLMSMKERAQAIGGTLRIRSGSGHGTYIEANVPRPVAS